MGAGELSVVAAVIVTLLLVVAGVAGFLFVAMAVLWFLRRRSAAAADAEPSVSKKRKKPKVDSEASTVIRDPKDGRSGTKDAKATPAPLTPSSSVRNAAGGAAAPPSPLAAGLMAPPPPPPFAGKAGAGAGAGAAADAKAGDGKGKGPLIGFFDEEKPEEGEQKTELFSRDMAARYAAMLDDEDDEGEHTELFSAAHLEAEMGGAGVIEDDTNSGKLPGKVVASDKK